MRLQENHASIDIDPGHMQCLFFPMTDPWDWHIYLHERLIFMINVGKCSMHGSYGYSQLPVQRSPKKTKKRSAPAIPAAKQSLKLRRRVAVLDLSRTAIFVEQNSGELPSLKLNIFAPENGWLEYDRFLLGFGLFSWVNC